MARTQRENLNEQSLSPCLRPRDAAAFLQIGLSTLWSWAKQGKVPKPIRLGGRATVWRRSDLEAYIGMNGTVGAQED